jgi:hypothetical protein
MSDAFDTLLPIITLLIGAGLGSFVKRGELRTTMRLEAADQLAELPTFLWATGGSEDWVNLNAALDRLAIRLRLAGVPGVLMEEFKHTAIAFWEGVEPIFSNEDGPVYATDAAVLTRWTTVSVYIGEHLARSNSVRRWIAGRAATRSLRELGPAAT